MGLLDMHNRVWLKRSAEDGGLANSVHTPTIIVANTAGTGRACRC